ncbi:MAG: hypothetical protein ACKO7N_05545, partial [Candidatus Nitrosotenuis sp.]
MVVSWLSCVLIDSGNVKLIAVLADCPLPNGGPITPEMFSQEVQPLVEENIVQKARGGDQTAQNRLNAMIDRLSHSKTRFNTRTGKPLTFGMSPARSAFLKYGRVTPELIEKEKRTRQQFTASNVPQIPLGDEEQPQPEVRRVEDIVEPARPRPAAGPQAGQQPGAAAPGQPGAAAPPGTGQQSNLGFDAVTYGRTFAQTFIQELKASNLLGQQQASNNGPPF